VTPPYQFKRPALADLREISLYTRREWNEEQEAIYMKGLFNCFDKIAARQTVNRDISTMSPGCLLYQVAHHLVIFRWLPDGRPEILRILHERMNVSMHVFEMAPSKPKHTK
jgi:toxin ParE1/3/4